VKKFDGAVAHHFDQLRALSDEMASLSVEGRCLWQELHCCDDPERRRTLRQSYHEVQRRWRGLAVEHRAMCGKQMPIL